MIKEILSSLIEAGRDLLTPNLRKDGGLTIRFRPAEELRIIAPNMRIRREGPGRPDYGQYTEQPFKEKSSLRPATDEEHRRAWNQVAKGHVVVRGIPVTKVFNVLTP